MKMEEQARKNGVSVILCCYNSSGRLQGTLTALSRQVADDQLPWEILIIDNNSDDNTDATAIKIWDSLTIKPAIPFHVYYEPLPGLGHARRRGLSIAAYNYVLFCDDDNWLAPGYVQGVYNILSKDNSIAACGGTGFPVFETAKPYWFDTYEEAFAVGPQSLNEEKNILLNLYGAGMAVNVRAMEKLEKTGFRSQMLGRTGKKLSSSEDTELTYAFVLMGYKLVYAKELHFSHYLTKERLQFSYLTKLFTAFGTDGPIRNLYYAHISKRPLHRYIKSWYFHLLLSLFRLVKYTILPPKKYGRTIYYKWNIAYIKQLFAIRNRYTYIIKNIQSIQNNPSSRTLVVVRNYNVSPV